MFALALAAACALTVADVREVEGQGLPKLPPLPQVQLPSLPKPLKPPPQLQLPETPQLPSVPLPRVQAPNTPAVPGAGSTPDVAPGGALPGTAGAGQTAAGGSAAGTRAGTASRSRKRDTADQRAAVRKRKASTRRERRLRRTVKGLWACSYAVSGFERDVLIRRAGLDGFSPASSGAVAQQLQVSVKRVRRAQRSGVRHLRGANRSDGCAMGSPSPAVGETVGALRAVATAPALVTDGNVTVADAPALPDSELGGQGDVLGDQAASTQIHLERPQIAGTLSAVTGGDDGSAPWLLILILAVIAVAASTPLLLNRRREATPAAAQYAPPPQQVVPEPAPPPRVEPEPARRARPRDELPPSPWTEPYHEPPSEPAPTPPEPKTEGQPSSRRAPGITFSAMASLAVTLLMRARRRR